MSVLRDSGRVTPRSVCQGEKTRVSIIILPTFVEALTKNDPYALYSGWPCGSRLQSGIIVVLQIVHWVSPPPPVGTPHHGDAARKKQRRQSPLQKRTTVTPSGCADARTPSPLRTNRPDASGCGRTPNNVGSSRRRAEPSPRVRVEGPYRTSSRRVSCSRRSQCYSPTQ